MSITSLPSVIRPLLAVRVAATAIGTMLLILNDSSVVQLSVAAGQGNLPTWRWLTMDQTVSWRRNQESPSLMPATRPVNSSLDQLHVDGVINLQWLAWRWVVPLSRVSCLWGSALGTLKILTFLSVTSRCTVVFTLCKQFTNGFRWQRRTRSKCDDVWLSSNYWRYSFVYRKDDH